tara:strand:+ start:304 stop:666 length:363 start_codon:yes stop_codon:yes gene_type:complete
MRVPSKEDLYKNQFHIEFLTADEEWKRLDTFTFYEFDRAVNLVINKFLKTETHHRIVDKDGKVIVFLDDTFIEEDEITKSIDSDTRWKLYRNQARIKLIKYLILISCTVLLVILISFFYI